MSRVWRGVIAEYRDRLPVTTRTPVITLLEGGTPLVPAGRLTQLTGCEVYLKVEGANPTGSFKDRGMTMAITKAVEEGSQAVICASTGNTSASAAAYAARAELVCAVLGDLVAVARNRLAGAPGPAVTSYAGLPARPIAETPTRYHVSLDVADRPGVLAQVAEEFARQDVSIQAVRQEGHGDDAQLVIVTHRGTDAALSATVEALRRLESVREVASVMRVEGEEAV